MKNAKFRMISLLLCMAMILGMAPAIRLFTPAIAAGNASVCEGHTHEGATVLGAEGVVTPVDAATLAAGGNFVLAGDISLAATVQPTADLHICLNGKTIHSSTTQFKMRSAALTVCDCSDGEAGKMQVSNATATSDAGIVYLDVGGIFSLYNGTLTGHTKASCGGGVRVNTQTSVFNMYGGTITGNAASNFGGAVYVYRGVFNMFGGTIVDNTAKNDNGIYIAGHGSYATTMNISGNAVVDDIFVNAATSHKTPILTIGKLASGANVLSSVALTAEDSSVKETANEGKYLYTHNDPHPDYTKIDGTTENVEGLLAAGGNFMLTGDITLSSLVQPTANLEICLNGYTIHGSTTLFKMRNAMLTVTDCSTGEPGKLQVSNATASSDAGVIYLDVGGIFNLHNGILTGHSKASCGGGVRVNTQTSVFNMYGGTITGNAASNFGGAVYVNRGVFNMYGGTIVGNTAKNDNGIYIAGHGSYATTMNISGNAVVDDIFVNASASHKTPVLTIGKLTPGANVVSSVALTVQDDTVKVTQNEGKYIYEFETSLYKNWSIFTENFEGYQAGADAFYNSGSDNAGAAYPYWGGLTGYHGTVGAASYAVYDIAADGENQYLKMTSVCGTKNNLVTKQAISGPYTLKMDFMFGSGETSAPIMAVTLTQGSSLGGDIMAYLAPGTQGARIYNGKDKVNQFVADADGNKMLFDYDTWYTMEYSLDLGSLTLSIWKTGDENTKLSATLAASHFNADILASSNTVRIDNVSNAARTDILCLDNFSLTKKVALNLQSFVAVEPGKVMTDLPAGDAANQLPAPTYSYALADPEFGYVNNRGKLVAGYKDADDTTVSEGETKLTLTLLDIRGNATDITFETTLVVGTANGVAIGEDIQVPESDIGKTQNLTAVVDSTVVTVPNYTIGWKSSNESVVTVANGVLTYQGSGSAKITAMVLDAEGKETKYYGSINVQVGTKALKVLTIGNSFTTDTMTYLSQLAYAVGARIEVGYLFRNSATVRQHAYNLAYNVNDYAWYTSNANNGKVTYVVGGVNLAEKVESQDWDVIILQQGTTRAGFQNTYNADLEYLVDYLEDVQPNAKLYWNMTWALEDGYTGSSGTAADFAEYFGSDQKVMYNAIVRAVDEMILGEDAPFSSANANNLGKGLGWGFDGCLFNGTAIQNLRETVDHDRDLTRDGYHLSYDLGRMVVGMATLKTLYDDLALGGSGIKLDLSTAITAAEIEAMIELSDSTEYKYTEADLPKIVAAATAAASVEGTPAQLDIPAQVKPEDVNEYAQTSIQTQAPQKLHFPDIKSLEDGTMLSIMLEYPEHAPTTNTSDPYSALAEGSSQILLYESADGGYSWKTSTPILVVDEMQLQQWGIVDTYDRYQRIGACNSQNYNAMADVRDPNLGTAYVDFDGDGDKEQVVIVTFWVNFYGATSATYQPRALLMLTGVRNNNGTYTWNQPQTIQGANMKRGDIASFSDGSILVPVIGSAGGVIPMTWDAEAKTWNEGSFVVMPHPEYPSKYYGEISVVAPDPDGQIVYAFCREYGAVFRSNDRGATWELIADEPGSIHQPGFTILDEDRVFVTWARTSYPRDIHGKIFYVNADWSDTVTQLIYASADRYSGNGTGDPSCALNANGEVIVVSYDNAFRAIVYTVVDPEDEKWLPIEMSDADAAVLYETEADAALSATNAIPNTVKPAGAYTIEATVIFTATTDKAVFATGAGAVTVTPEGLALNTPTYVQISVIGNRNYVKVWQTEEPADFEIQSDAATAVQQPSVTGSGATLAAVAVSNKIIAQLQERLVATIGDADMLLNYQIQPTYAGYAFKSSNESVATVDENGMVSFKAEGTAIITMTVSGDLELTCEVTVKGLPAELTGEGNSNVFVKDDYESYTPGTNALWNDYWADKAGSFYNFENAANMNSTSNGEIRYDITEDATSGNQYLELNGRTTWFMNKEAITGNYTVQFDIFFEADGVTLNLTPWQNDLLVETNEIHAFVNLQSNQARFQICGEKLTDYAAGSGENPYLHYIGNSEESDRYGKTEGASGAWQTVKLVRIDGGMYLKVWKTYDANGNRVEEPTAWTMTLTHGVLDTDMDSHIRFQYVGSSTGKSAYIDNLIVSQQTYDVTYDVDGEKKTETVAANSLLSKPADPVKEGYTFAGWFDGDKKWDFALDTLEQNVTLTAQWTAPQFTVIIGDEEKTVELGAKLEKPADPTKEGYTFVGWYNGDEAWDFETDTVTGDVELVAKFEINKYTVTVNGVEQTVEHGAKLQKPADPTKEGYTFVGWYNGDKAWNFETDTVTGDLNLTAKWEAAQSGSGSGSGSDEPSKTADTSMPMIFGLLVMMSVTGLAVIVNKKKNLI